MISESLGALLLFLLLAGFLGLLVVAFVLAVSMLVAAVKLILFLLVIPLRVIGWGVGLGLTAAAYLVKGGLLVGTILLLVLLGGLPLVPLVLLAGLIAYLLRSTRRRGSSPVRA